MFATPKVNEVVAVVLRCGIRGWNWLVITSDYGTFKNIIRVCIFQYEQKANELNIQTRHHLNANHLNIIKLRREFIGFTHRLQNVCSWSPWQAKNVAERLLYNKIHNYIE